MDQCFNCKGYGHHKSQCPSKFMGFAKKKLVEEDDIEEEVYEPSTKVILKAEALEEGEAKERAETGFIGILHSMLAMQKISPVKPKKKKVDSFPLHYAPHGRARIFGPPPKLNGVEFSKRKEVDAATLH